MESVAQQLHDIGALCFGQFTLKSGIQSPVYVDLRLVMSRPQLMMNIASKMWSRVVESGAKVDVICPVPTGAIPLATCLSVQSGLPMIFWRKEVKDYGRQRPIEGKYETGQRCLVVEDVFVSGQSTMETVEILRNAGFAVEHVVVFLDREHGGKKLVEDEGVTVHRAVTMTKLLEKLFTLNLIDEATRSNCEQFIESVQLRALPRYVGVAKKPKIADDIGPYMCMLKTHVDILDNFELNKMLQLKQLAKKHDFLIFEDRKFADIGNTVQMQYQGGVYRMCEWADVINAHTLPGSGVIQGLKNVGQPREQALVLVAEMSSLDHLCTKQYIQKTVELANRNKDYVIGFICQSLLTSDPEMLHMVPGVRLEEGSDGLGQGYITPHQAFQSGGADLVIVGRGIVKAEDSVAKAREYQAVSYHAYCQQIQAD